MTAHLPAIDIGKGAVLSPDKSRRFLLWRVWRRERPRVLYVMLNPSIADAQVDDPTIRRCWHFAYSDRAGGFLVANLLSQRSSLPSRLENKPEPSEADQYLRFAMEMCARVVVGWGTCSSVDRAVRVLLKERKERVVEEAARAGRELHCLRSNLDGSPEHPLFVPNGTSFVPWKATP